MYSVDMRWELHLKMRVLSFRSSIKGASLIPSPCQRPHGICTTSQNRNKFVTLAEKRTNKPMQAIAFIGNLSNNSSYSYTVLDVRKIKRALINQMNIAFARFAGQLSKNSGFTLK